MLVQHRFVCAMFSCAAVFQEVGGGQGVCVCVFPRPRADIQKKGKSTPLDIQAGVLWAQNSSQEVHVGKKQHHEIFLHCQLGLCCVPAELLLQA